MTEIEILQIIDVANTNQSMTNHENIWESKITNKPEQLYSERSNAIFNSSWRDTETDFWDACATKEMIQMYPACV